MTPEEPACRSWKVGDITARGILRKAELLAELPLDTPFQRLWQETKADMLDPAAPGALLELFHDRRCALCGLRRRLIVEHDHDSGLVRGLACGSCNALEGVSRVRKQKRLPVTGLIENYWSNSPATILGLRIRYGDYMQGEWATGTGA